MNYLIRLHSITVFLHALKFLAPLKSSDFSFITGEFSFFKKEISGQNGNCTDEGKLLP